MDILCQNWLWYWWIRKNNRNFAAQFKIISQMMNLPQDPMMLFSVINMKLRDQYSSLDELCEDMDVNRKELEDKLAAFGFEYSEENNKFW